RPVMSAARVGEQSAVECICVYRSPAFAMRSSAGVGMTPPKVDGTPYPESSVMMRRTLGAPFGGTMRGGHQALDCRALSLITPPNAGSGGGSCLLSIEVVAPGEPGGGTGAGCWPYVAARRTKDPTRASTERRSDIDLPSLWGNA